MKKISRKESREHLAQFNITCELVKLIKHYFPNLLSLLKQIPDPRHQSYITYPSVILLMTRILSSLVYISSMRKTSEEFNSDKIINNIWALCGVEPSVEELPYWETINRYLQGVDPEKLQEAVHCLCHRLLRSRAFENMRIRGKYWQIIIDGTQLCSTHAELDGKSLYRIHKKGTENEQKENYYYVLEAKLVLHPKVIISIQTEFVDNEGRKEFDKQDCEWKACQRLMEKLKKAFPRLPICICADSLYACEGFWEKCRQKNWRYILRYKEGSIPSIGAEYRKLKELEKNYQEKKSGNEKEWTDYVTNIDYNGYKINLAEYGEYRETVCKRGKKKGELRIIKKAFWYITDLPISAKNITELIERGRMRGKIENEGFNAQKNHGYNIGHMYSRNYQALKNHYFLIQIGHMIGQFMDAWEKLWRKTKQSKEQKHRRILECMKQTSLKEYEEEIKERIQIRLI